MVLDDIRTPTLLLDERKSRANIRLMAEKARRNNVLFRPHFKTHQSAVIGEWFREEGVSAITVSSVRMALFFADHRWDDITIAFPVNILEAEEITGLARRIRLNLVVTSCESLSLLVSKLSESPETSRHNTLLNGSGHERPDSPAPRAGIFIKIDTGLHRSGLRPEDSEEISRIIDFCDGTPFFSFRGFLTHSGHTYKVKGKPEAEKIWDDAGGSLQELRERYRSADRKLLLSAGDTPSCSLVGDLSGVDEIRPGNFVFYDVMQYYIGSCRPDRIAVCMACPVVELHPEREEIVIYGGAVHFSKEAVPGEGGDPIFGLVVPFSGEGWGDPLPGCYVKSLSQEHGIVKIGDPYLSLYKPGSLIGILPVHACLTAHEMKGYLTLDGISIDHLSRCTFSPLWR